MSALINAARGETMITINGAPRTLCLTLGALAALEAAFDVISFEALGERLAQLSASDLLIVLAALLQGGGGQDTPETLAGARIDPRAASAAVADAFRRALGDG